VHLLDQQQVHHDEIDTHFRVWRLLDLTDHLCQFTQAFDQYVFDKALLDDGVLLLARHAEEPESHKLLLWLRMVQRLKHDLLDEMLLRLE